MKLNLIDYSNLIRYDIYMCVSPACIETNFHYDVVPLKVRKRACVILNKKNQVFIAI